MLEIVLCDKSEKFLQSVSDVVEDIIVKNNMSASLRLATSNHEEILDEITEDELFLILMDFCYNTEDDGILCAQDIRRKNRDSHIVFSTKHAELISRAFSGLIRPSGVLLKPIKKSELINIICDIYTDYVNINKVERYYSVTSNGTIYRIEYKNILYFEAAQKKVFLHTTHQVISFYGSLSTLEESLDSNFIRCHKSFIVNANNATNMDLANMLITMADGNLLPISRTAKASVKEYMNNKKDILDDPWE